MPKIKNEIPKHLQKAVDYIKNAGGRPKLEHFIEDWEPIGENLRVDLYKAGIAFVMDGCIYIPDDDE